MLPERWLTDEMLGRLTRYLRIVGLDTAYARGLDDRTIARWARDDDRFLLTRDRQLATRVERSLLLESPGLAEQWAALHRRFPSLPFEVRFLRCTLCNGPLGIYEPRGDRALPPGTPADRVAGGLALHKCEACGHLYWEGSHTADVRRRLQQWAEVGGG